MIGKLAAVVLAGLLAFAMAATAYADSTGYEGQPGNQSSGGQQGYEGQPGNQSGHHGK